MSRFAPALRRLARELDLPPAVRAAIVLEMAADLETVYEHHLHQGLDEAEAANRAEEMVLGSSEVARRLGRLHRDSWRGWSYRLAGRTPGPADLLLLGLAVFPILLLSAVVAVRTAARAPGPLIWPLLTVGVAIVAVTALEAGRILGGNRGRATALPLLLVLSAVAPAVGLLAFVLATHGAAAAFAAGAASGSAPLEMIKRFGNGGALFLVGLLLGIAGAFSWFVLLNRAHVHAAREVDALLAGGAAPAAAESTPDVLPIRKRRRS